MKGWQTYQRAIGMKTITNDTGQRNSSLESTRNKEPKTELLGTITCSREVRGRKKGSD